MEVVQSTVSMQECIRDGHTNPNNSNRSVLVACGPSSVLCDRQPRRSPRAYELVHGHSGHMLCHPPVAQHCERLYARSFEDPGQRREVDHWLVRWLC